MVDPVDDIARQARQGSVSAIIQVLNEKLGDSGVRTRAMFDQGVLQLLCEAPKPEQLERSTLIAKVRQILESLQPRNVRRVNINSRIVREQQLLWLEEINRDPTNQLLWSEEITLAKPSLLQRLSQSRRDTKSEFGKTALPKSSPRLLREKKVFWRGLIGGASLSLFLLLLGWALYNWLGSKSANQPNSAASNQAASNQAASNQAASNQAAKPPQANVASPIPAGADPFAEAVRLAEATVTTGRSAQTSADWLEVASRWQRASDLMRQIRPEDPRYPTAQDRVQLYQQNSEAALAQAQKVP